MTLQNTFSKKYIFLSPVSKKGIYGMVFLAIWEAALLGSAMRSEQPLSTEERAADKNNNQQL